MERERGRDPEHRAELDQRCHARPRSGQRCSHPCSASRTPPFGRRGIPREMADSRVLATARRIHIRRRVAILRDSSHFRGFRPAIGPKQSRAWHLWSSSSRSVAPRPRSRSPRRLSRRLHGVTRRNASSAEYRLLALRRVSPRIRRTASAHVAQFGTRPLVPCLTFHKARFFS